MPALAAAVVLEWEGASHDEQEAGQDFADDAADPDEDPEIC